MRTLGVLGGMGPAAAAEFLRLVAELAPAATDQQHPRVVMLSEPRVPDRGAALLGRGESPLPALRKCIDELVNWGADLLAIPCGTAHVFVDRFRDELPVPLVHIVQATLCEAARTSPRGAWLVGTTGMIADGIYQRCAERAGYRLLIPGAEVQSRVQECIGLVKAGRAGECRPLLREAVAALWRRERLPVLVACTDLPMALRDAGCPEGLVVSSLHALAAACVNELYDTLERPVKAGE
ncbi:aspartate/glutamate racemase family protein [Spongiactinospora sp. 9N601]|uniref:aspartate/glutamate racemase family protein n=1 Tax=Spongiactinospora sp. 9N601 TaxID=3375149 RepID=UPI00379976B3